MEVSFLIFSSIYYITEVGGTSRKFLKIFQIIFKKSIDKHAIMCYNSIVRKGVNEMIELVTKVIDLIKEIVLLTAGIILLIKSIAKGDK